MGQVDGVERLRAEFDLDAAVAYASKHAQRCVREAVASLELLPAGSVNGQPSGTARESLTQLGEYVLRRNL